MNLLRNPASNDFRYITRGSSSRIYENDNKIEAVVSSVSENRILYIDAAKDVLIEARKRCNNESKKFLPDIIRKRIDIDEDGDREYIYEMPKYLVGLTHSNDFLEDLITDSNNCKSILFDKSANWSLIISYIRKKFEKYPETKPSCDALDNILIASKKISKYGRINQDIKIFNMATSYEGQVIFLDPIVFKIHENDLFKVWENNGFSYYPQ